MADFKKNDLLFLPLGGSGEIGMNVNLYHYNGKWIMFDLGMGFADDYLPGIDMLAPDLSFIAERRKDLLGLVLTHAHEDHIGAIHHLWNKLRCPLYATPFTASIIRSKLTESNFAKEVEIIEVQPGSAFDVGDFSLEMVQITHSIPEMNGIIMRTDHGTVLHTGDWKLDPEPVVGESTDFDKLKNLGDEGVLAMVSDSTNIFTEGSSGSEGDLFESLSELVAGCKKLVAVTTFASNVARLDTIARVAQANGRKVILAGRSLIRINAAARESGYLQDLPEFLTEEASAKIPRHEQLVVCTGCQGEERAAVSKIIRGAHRYIRLNPGDSIIFSSKVIPGNEKKINYMMNKFVEMRVEVFTEKDHFVHVSGHPCRDEVARMYELVRPEIAVPVHGEAVHLHEHAKFAKELGVPQAIEIKNGEVIRLAPGEPASLRHVDCGYFAVDGTQFLEPQGRVMKMRRKLQNEGIVFVSIVINRNGKIVAEPRIFTPGVLDEKESRHVLGALSEELIDVIEAQRDYSEDSIVKIVRSYTRRFLKEEIGKKMNIEVQVVVV